MLEGVKGVKKHNYTHGINPFFRYFCIRYQIVIITLCTVSQQIPEISTVNIFLLHFLSFLYSTPSLQHASEEKMSVVQRALLKR